MSGGIAAIIGAAIGAIATTVGVIVTTILKNRADAQQRQDAQNIERKRQERELVQERERQRQELVRRYLFQLQDAVKSLRLRLTNWAERGGEPWAESVDPGYWDITTLYAFGRALAAERILILEGVYAAIDDQFPGLADSLQDSKSVDQVLKRHLEQLFRYHRRALDESLLQWRPEGYRLLMYTEWRRRYEDPSSGLDRLLKPTTASLKSLSPEQDLEGLIKELADIESELKKATSLPVKDKQELPASPPPGEHATSTPSRTE